MSDHQRLHRKDPVRIGPIRNWSTLYRQPNPSVSLDSSENSSSADHATQGRSWNDPVSHGVKLGYRVIEEYLRQGQQAAQQINNRSYSPGAMGNDIRKMVERLARYYTDLGALWGDLVNSLVANPEFLNSFLRPFQSPPPSSTTNGVSANGATAVVIEVVSTRPTQVTLDLHPHSEKLSLTTYGLRAVDPEKPPLTGITFESSPNPGPVRLRIYVPDGQSPDIYTGIIVDKTTNLPRGTLSVRIAA
jgi:hypothetical protein